MAKPSVFKIATWNVNSLRMRLDRVLGFLDRFQPDVLCLQELKCQEKDYPFEALEKAGYHSSVYGQKTWNGVAVLSKTEPSDIVRGFEDQEEDPQARFIAVKIGKVWTMSAYVPNGQAVGTEKYDYKLRWLSRLRDYLRSHHRPSDPLVLVGDFNIAPEDRDVYDPDLWRGKILFSDPEKEALKNVAEFGFVDTFRMHCQDEGKYSWWDYRQLGFPKNRGLRIDFVWVTHSLAQKCSNALIDRDERKGSKPSDHAPVIAEFKF